MFFLGFEKCILKSEQKEMKGMNILLMNGRKRKVFGLFVFRLFVKILHIHLLTLNSYFEKSFEITFKLTLKLTILAKRFHLRCILKGCEYVSASKTFSKIGR